MGVLNRIYSTAAGDCRRERSRGLYLLVKTETPEYTVARMHSIRWYSAILELDLNCSRYVAC